MKNGILLAVLFLMASRSANAASPREVDAYLYDEITSLLALKSDCKCLCISKVRVLFTTRVLLRDKAKDLPPLGSLGTEIDALLAQQCVDKSGTTSTATAGTGGGPIGTGGMSRFVQVTSNQPSTGSAGSTHMGRPDAIKIQDFLVAVNRLPKQSRETFYRELSPTYRTSLREWTNTNTDLVREVMGEPIAMPAEMPKIESATAFPKLDVESMMTERQKALTTAWNLDTDELPLLSEPENRQGKLPLPPVLAALSTLNLKDQQTFVQALPSSAQSTYRKWMKDHQKDTQDVFDVKTLFDVSKQQ